MSSVHIAGFSITVSDLDRSAEFYTRGLGLLEKAKEDHGDMHEIMVGGEHDVSVIALVNYSSQAVIPRRGGDLDKILLRVDDAVGIYERALEQGGATVSPPRALDDAGVTFAELRDPDGVLVQLIEHHVS
jgi:predicted enzyme related to lactoylglutathione lyase